MRTSASKGGIKSSVRKALRPAVLLGASLMVLQGAAHAEGLGEGQELPGVTVEGERPELDNPRYTAPLLELPQTVTVVDGEIIEQQNLLGLRDILSTLPGITFGAGEGGGGYGDSINLRGYSANTDIFVDGVRDAAQYTRSDPFNLQQVELTNGANSVYSGAGSVGGSINLVNKRPLEADFAALTGALGTDSYGRLTFDANRSWENGLAGRLNVMVHQSDVPGRDVETVERWGIAPSFTFGLGADTTFTALLLHQEDENIPEYGVPFALGPFNDGPLPGVDPSDYFGYSNVDTQETSVDSLTFIVDHRFSENVAVRNLTRWSTVDQLIIVNPPQGTWCIDSGINPWTGAACGAPGTYQPSGPRGGLRDTSNEILINQTDFTFNFETGGLRHTLVAGVSFSREDYRLDNGNVLRQPLGATPNPTLPVMDISDPDHVYTGPINYIRTGFTNAEVSNQAIYVFDRIEIGEQWELNGGIRIERNEGTTAAATIATPYPAPPAQPVVTAGTPFENADDLLSYRFGIVYQPVENASIYYAFGNSETPSQASVRVACNATNCNVDPEEGESHEIGVKWEVFDRRLLLTAAVFRNERTNFRVASGDPLVPEQVLDGSSRVDGVALGASGLITDNWSIFANYTFLDSEILQSISDVSIGGGVVDFQAGDPLPNTPEHALGVWTTYSFPFGLMVGYGVTYNGEYTFNRASATADLYYTDAYWLHRAMVSYELTDRAVIQLNINNLLDEEYYARVRNNPTNGWATPGEARSAVVSLTYRF